MDKNSLFTDSSYGTMIIERHIFTLSHRNPIMWFNFISNGTKATHMEQ